MNRIIAIVISMICLFSCTNMQPSLINASPRGNIDDAEFKEAVARSGKEILGARIIFIRESNFFHVTRWADISVGEHTVNLRNKSTNFIDVNPGKFDIVVKGSFGEGNNKISFDAKAGQTYYFEVSPRTENVISTIRGGTVGRALEALVQGDKAGPFEIKSLEESVAKEKFKALK